MTAIDRAIVQMQKAVSRLINRKLKRRKRR
jgi:hypothetical protein